MSYVGPETSHTTQRLDGNWRPPETRNGHRFPGGLLALGIVAGLGYLAWNYFGPDLQRYIKMSRM